MSPDCTTDLPNHSLEPWKNTRIPVRASGTNPANERAGQAVLRDPIRFAPGALELHQDRQAVNIA